MAIDDERFLDHPAAELAERLDVLASRPEPPSTAGILHVVAEWLGDVEERHTVVCRNPSQGEPDWYPRPPSVSFVRRDIAKEASRRDQHPRT